MSPYICGLLIAPQCPIRRPKCEDEVLAIILKIDFIERRAGVRAHGFAANVRYEGICIADFLDPVEDAILFDNFAVDVWVVRRLDVSGRGSGT
jgi:hypothetical protein